MPNRFLTTTAWVLERKTLEIVDQVITARLSGEVRDLSEFEFAAQDRAKNLQDEKPYQVIDGVAVISMIGLIGKRFNLFSEWSGGVSTERMQVLLEDALTDPSIAAIVVKVDSPGGTVDGTFELCDWMLANRGVKPVNVYIDGQCCSGAYAFAACCDRIYGFRTAQVGSVSAVCCHYDRSGADAKAGIKRTFIVSGEYKRMASDAAPLDEKGEEYLQGFIQRYHNMFVELAADGRRTTPEEVQARFGNGRVHLAAEALAIGMIDGIMTLPETIDAARNAAMEEEAMTKEEFKAKYPGLHAELIAEGRAEEAGSIDAVLAERTTAAVGVENERLFGLYARLHGDEAEASFQKLAVSGMTAEQMDALAACGFAAKGETAADLGSAAEAAEKKRLLEAIEQTGQDDLKAGGTGGGPADFMAAVEAHIQASGGKLSKGQAVQAMAKQHPDLHKEYLAKANTK